MNVFKNIKDIDDDKLITELKSRKLLLESVTDAYEYLENEIQKRMDSFFENMEGLEDHIVVVEIQNNGRYIVINNFNKDAHIPTEILLQFASKFHLTLESVTNYHTKNYDNIKGDYVLETNANIWSIIFENID